MASLQNITLVPVVARCQRADKALADATARLEMAALADTPPVDLPALQDTVDAAAEEYRQAWRAFVDEVNYPIGSALAKGMRVREDVEDLFQDFLWIICERLHEIDCDRNPASYCYRVANNLKTDYIRGVYRAGMVFDLQASADVLATALKDPRPLPSDTAPDLVENLRNAFRAMTDEHKDVLWRKCVLDQSRQEIADESGLTERQVKRRIEKAMARIRMGFPPENESL